MIEAREFVNEIESAKKILLENNAAFKGEYRCRDLIYRSTNQDVGLESEFLRLRINEKNIWDESYAIVAVKQTEKREIGKNSIIPLKKEFNTEEEALSYIEDNFHGSFVFDFEFTRTGWQYDLGRNQVDLERVENIPNCYTIEVKSPTNEGIREMIGMLKLTNTIQGPTVVEIRKKIT